jgi:Ca2+-binding EF-hand superfamily protein
VVSQVDKRGRGWLDQQELYRFCSLMVADISPGQLRYLEVMLDHDGDRRVSFPDVQHLATISRRTGLTFTVKSDLDATDVLKKAAVYMFDKRLSISEFYQRFDDHSTQRLGKQQLQKMIRVVMKGASGAEVAHLVREFVKVFDVDCDGHISPKEWEHAVAEGEPALPQLEDGWGAIDTRTDFQDQGQTLTSNTIRRMRSEHAMLRKVPCRFTSSTHRQRVLQTKS